MIYRQARIARALVARLEGGEDVHAGLRELARWEKLDAAVVRGGGTLEEVEFARADGGRARLEGPLAAASISGTLAIRDGALEIALQAVLAAPSGALHAGEVVSARAAALDLVVDVLEDVGLEWRLDPAPGPR